MLVAKGGPPAPPRGVVVWGRSVTPGAASVVVRPRCGVDDSVVRRVSEGAVSERPGRGVSVAPGSVRACPQAEIAQKEIVTVAITARMHFVIR